MCNKGLMLKASADPAAEVPIQALQPPVQPHASNTASKAARGRASLYPGYWLNSSESMLLVVASGRFSTNRMLLGGASPVALTPACDAQQVSAYFSQRPSVLSLIAS